jgi:hypothetical protein
MLGRKVQRPISAWQGHLTSDSLTIEICAYRRISELCPQLVQLQPWHCPRWIGRQPDQTCGSITKQRPLPRPSARWQRQPSASLASGGGGLRLGVEQAYRSCQQNGGDGGRRASPPLVARQLRTFRRPADGAPALDITLNPWRFRDYSSVPAPTLGNVSAAGGYQTSDALH